MRNKVGACCALLGLLVSLIVVNWWLSTTAISRWQAVHLRWNYAYHVLFPVFPLLGLALLRSRAASYGLSLKGWRLDARVGVYLAIPLIAFPLLGDALFGDLAVKPSVARFGLGNALVFQIIFVGFFEELLFRGFFQGEFNRVFGRPFTFGSTRFGLGLYVTALLFGIVHLLNPFNPLSGGYSLDWVMFGSSAAFALIAGLIRERTGGLIAVSLFHFGYGMFPKLFVVGSVSGSGMLLSWLVALAVIARLLFKREELPATQTA